MQLTLVWNAASWKAAQPQASRLASALWRVKGNVLLHSVWFNWNPAKGNAILAPERYRFYHMFGDELLEERVMGVSIFFQPFAFRQANLDAFEEKVLPELLRYIPAGSAVAEFCAGVGVIGLVALRRKTLRRLVASEINPAAEELFWRGYRAMDKDGLKESVVEYIVGSDASTIGIVDNDIDVVIVDPPRSGLSEEMVAALARPNVSSLRRIIYLSCGFDAFKRDSRVLYRGEWVLRDAHAFVLFPGSDYVETLAIFDRKSTEDNDRKPAEDNGRKPVVYQNRKPAMNKSRKATLKKKQRPRNKFSR